MVSCVPVKGGEDVLILCLNPAPLSTQYSVSLQCVIRAGCLVTGLLNCWQFFVLSHASFLFCRTRLDSWGRGGGGGRGEGEKSYLPNSLAGLNFKTPSLLFN